MATLTYWQTFPFVALREDAENLLPYFIQSKMIMLRGIWSLTLEDIHLKVELPFPFLFFVIYHLDLLIAAILHFQCSADGLSTMSSGAGAGRHIGPQWPLRRYFNRRDVCKLRHGEDKRGSCISKTLLKKSKTHIIMN